MLERIVHKAVADALETLFPGAAAEVVVETPREKSHGDFATNVAMTMARTLKRAPRDIARDLAASLETRDDLFSGVEIAGPGFINFRIAPAAFHRGLAEILSSGRDWGRTEDGGGRRIQVEFVSANPTGPLNVVNARAAAYGSTLTRLLSASGFDARSEFYINDVGRQIELLGQSVVARWRQLRGDADAAIPPEGYQGEYLKDLAAGLDPKEMEDILSRDETAAGADMGRLAVDRMQALQQADLEAYGTRFDRWFRQSELYPKGVEETFAFLTEHGHVFDREGARWFRSSAFGDDQDRVLIRANGEPTYFLADLAYHRDKAERGFDRVIDIWGPDHHGYIERMQAGMEALGKGRDWLEILIVQQVNLLSGGKPAKMSKRRGEFITLRDLIDEVGKDTATFFFLMRRAESHLDFDMDLAKEESDENPVYYVKYAHARISGVLRKAEEEGAADDTAPDLGLLEDPRELELIKTLSQFPLVVSSAAREREPLRLTNYLREVAQAFHLFYHHCRVVGEDRGLSRARLALTRAARLVLANGLGLMDIEAPERM